MHKTNADYQYISVEFDTMINASLLKEIKGIEDAVCLKNYYWSIRANNEKDVRPEIFKFAVKNNITVLSMNIEEQSLEQTFHELTKK